MLICKLITGKNNIFKNKEEFLNNLKNKGEITEKIHQFILTTLTIDPFKRPSWQQLQEKDQLFQKEHLETSKRSYESHLSSRL